MGEVNSRFIYFIDLAAVTWKGTTLESTYSETLELYVGPGLLVFNLPLTLNNEGTLKVFFSFTPHDGGIIMRMRTTIDEKIRRNPLKRMLAWFIAGIAASQLEADIRIMENKIRLKKPMVQAADGPWSRTDGWLKQFYSASSTKASTSRLCAYKNDW